MASKFQLQIPEPCHENWDQMTPVEQGRFCGACQQNVVDFTGMSDAQLIAFFKKPSTGSVCGRFHTDQLHRDFAPQQKRMPWLKYFFQLFIPAFLVSQKAVAQGKPVLHGKNKRTETCTNSDTKPLPAIENKKKREALVVNASGEAIPFASISSIDQSFFATADENGRFEIPIRKNTSSIRLVISSVGYLTKEETIAFINNTESQPVRFILEADRVMMEEVVIESNSMGKIVTQMAGGLSMVRSLTLSDRIKDTVTSFFATPSNIFPNPVARGQNLSIRCTSVLNDEIITVRLFSNAGQLVKELKLSIKKGKNQITVPVESRLSAGIYFVSLQNQQGKKMMHEKIIIQ